MISQEFKTTVASKNLLRTRIMLKDSFIIDPTLTQLNEMLSYAKMHLPGLFVPFDGEKLENDRDKWDKNIMNSELVQLVNNFSEVRLNHLKKVVAKVLAVEINKIYSQRSTNLSQPIRSSKIGTASAGKATAPQDKEAARRKAVGEIRNGSRKIQCTMDEINSRGTWKLTNIEDIEEAAKIIIRAAQIYKNNR